MKSRKKITIASIILISLILIIVGFFNYEMNRKLPLNASLGEIKLEGLDRNGALAKIASEVKKLEKMIIQIVITDSLIKNFSLEELGVSYNASKTVTKIFDNTSWIVGIFAKKSQAMEDKTLSFYPVVEVEGEKIKNAIEAYLVSQEKDFDDAQITWAENKWYIKEASNGVILKKNETERVISKVLSSTFPYAETVRVVAEYEEIDPNITALDLDPLMNLINQIVDREIVVSYERNETTINLKDDPTWLIVNQADNTVSLNKKFSQQWISQYAASVDVAAGEILIKGIDEIASEYDGKIVKRANFEGDFKTGKKVKQDVILSDLKNLFADSSLDRKILVKAEPVSPKIVSEVEGYNFPNILSTGISSFRYGNHPNRIKNIKLSLGAFKGVIIDPGEEFSFNRATGWITYSKGYTMTKIISEGRVTKGLGGGVCQSSTTVYRSILNAGLQVTERRNHSLDVVYYHEYGYGLDATVYTDSRSDLQFINDFPGPILVNAYTDDVNNLAFIEFYGTTDNRIVELTNVNTGDYLFKKWIWKIIWPDREEVRTVQSRYFVPRPEEETNPLEA